MIESGADRGDGARFRTRHAIGSEQTVLAILPGSRRAEVQRLLGVFRETVARLSNGTANLVVVIPTVANVADAVARAAQDWPVRTLVVGPDEIHDAFAAARAALCASGTVSLELAMARVPHVVAYKVNQLSGFAFWVVSRTRFVNLINILLGRPAVPELLQYDCTPHKLAAAVGELLADDPARELQRTAFHEALAMLAPPGASPSRLAARAVIEVAKARSRTSSVA